MNPPRPRVRLDAVNRPFWTGGGDGKLNITHCADCGEYTHPPLPICRHCHSENVGPRAVAGTGTVATMSINHQAWVPSLEVPFVIARVALDGVPGVYLTTNIVGSPVDEVHFDDPVRVAFDEQDGIFYPVFEKAD